MLKSVQTTYRTTILIPHVSKVMLKILQARPQQYVNRELSDVQAGFRKGRGIRDQIADISWIIEKARVPEKRLLLLYWLCQSLWLCGSQQTGKFWKRWEHQTTLPASCMQVLYAYLYLYTSQEATVTGRHGTTDWFQIGKGVRQGYILSPCLFNLYVEYIMWNAGLDEAQAGIKMPGEISITDRQMIPPLRQKVKRN